jgi:hypothetical protein
VGVSCAVWSCFGALKNKLKFFVFLIFSVISVPAPKILMRLSRS